ncbi:MAG: hypothetical protein AABY53_07175 [Bdellovibrionota bacterium]
MKSLLAFVFLFTMFTNVHAVEYSDNRCIYSGDDLPTIQKGFEAIFREFKKSQKSCCIHAVVSACDDAQIALVCKINVSKSAGSCPEECKTWAADCGDYVSTSDLRGATFKDK